MTSIYVEKKMYGIISHPGNVDQCHNEISPPHCQNVGCLKHRITNAGKDVEKAEIDTL